jgi:hypothetical protein
MNRCRGNVPQQMFVQIERKNISTASNQRCRGKQGGTFVHSLSMTTLNWKCGYSRPGKLEVSHSKVIDGAGISCLKAERCCGCFGEDVPALLKASEEVSSAFLSV